MESTSSGKHLLFNSSLCETATARQMLVFGFHYYGCIYSLSLGRNHTSCELNKDNLIYQNNSKTIVSLWFKIPFMNTIEENKILNNGSILPKACWTRVVRNDNLKVWMRFFGVVPWKIVFFFLLVYNKNTSEAKFVSLFTITHQITAVIWNIQVVKLFAWVNLEHFVVE